MARVKENLKRTGLKANCVTSDAFAFQEDGFDAILLDAPCSATGTIRRHPDLPYAKDGSEFMALIEQQDRLIDHALTLLKPGGRLVFCGLRVDTAARDVAGVDPAWFTEEGGIRLRPDYWAEQGGMDGFYIAVLVKA